MRKLELVQPCDFTPEHGSSTEEPHVFLCHACGHTVRDLSAMTEAEAFAFLDRRRPDECVQFRADQRGRVRFADGVGSLIGRIARDAKPMIAVASLALAACGEGQPVGPHHPASSPHGEAPATGLALRPAESSAVAAVKPAPSPGAATSGKTGADPMAPVAASTGAVAPSADSTAPVAASAGTAAPSGQSMVPVAPSAQSGGVVPPFPGPGPARRWKRNVAAPVPTPKVSPRFEDFRLAGR